METDKLNSAAQAMETQRTVFDQLYRQGVEFGGMVLKPSMVISGNNADKRAPVEELAERTLHCLSQTVPAAVTGIAFLPGGQDDEEATAHLNAINQSAKQGHYPWRLTFSYARALQHPALESWKGNADNIDKARRILLQRAKLNALASQGEYNPTMERQAAQL